jgi:hypothetical protein
MSDPGDPHGWHAVTEAFLEWMAIQNYSPETVDNRRTYMRYFVQWAQERGLHHPMEVTQGGPGALPASPVLLPQARRLARALLL